MTIQISFPAGMRVDARLGHHLITTDQPVKHGGGGTSATPFDLFLASLATCAGFYALRFCQQRDIDTEGLALTLDTERDEAAKRTARIVMRLSLPFGFPHKYRAAILRATDQCAVKRHLLDPPELEIEIASSARVA